MLVKSKNKEYNVEVASSFFDQVKGLMFSDKKNLLFILTKERIFTIHSNFVFFSFDAIYLDKDKKVIEVKRLKPFEGYYTNKIPALYLLELSEDNDVQIGETLTF